MPQEVIKQGEDRMKKAIEAFQKELSLVRTGKANPSILNTVLVEYWGTLTPVNQVASISVPEPQSIVIKPYDKSLIKGIEKAILTANLGFNPNNDGEIIRLVVPPLTESVRKDLVKSVKKSSEDAKIAIRNIRRDMIERLRKMEKDSLISEDILRKQSDETQKLTDKYIVNIDTITKEKEQTLLSF